MTLDTDDNTRRPEGDAMRKVTQDLREVQDKAARTVNDLRDQAGAALEQVKAETSELAASASQRVRGLVDQQKEVGAEALGALARAAHDAAAQLEQQTPMVARAVHQAADGAARISRDLRDRSVADLASTVSDFARREPVAFFAGTVLAGLVMARFVKSSAAPANTVDEDRAPHDQRRAPDFAGSERERASTSMYDATQGVG